MTSWRGDASQQSQDDLDRLLNIAIEFAQQMLAKHGEFYPYAAAISENGSPSMIDADLGVENPTSSSVRDAAFQTLREQRDELRAAAVVTDIRLPELDTDAIQVELEHAEGSSIKILLPYAMKRRGRLEYGQIQAQPGTPKVWG
jgi:hypothetical protein